MIAVIVVIAVIAAAMGALFWYGLRGRPNEPPALGTNNPLPSNLRGSDDSVFPGAVVSDRERFLDDADRRLRGERAERD